MSKPAIHQKINKNKFCSQGVQPIIQCKKQKTDHNVGDGKPSSSKPALALLMFSAPAKHPSVLQVIQDVYHVLDMTQSANSELQQKIKSLSTQLLSLQRAEKQAKVHMLKSRIKKIALEEQRIAKLAREEAEVPEFCKKITALVGDLAAEKEKIALLGQELAYVREEESVLMSGL